DPTDASFQPYARGWALADLADAAAYGDGDIDRVRGLLDPWDAIATQTRSPQLVAQLAYADGVLAERERPEPCLQAAIAASEAAPPFHRARAQLAYGGWLRRQRRGADARTPLREAARAFDALGLRCFAERAYRELRATGERRRRRDADNWAALSPQE